MCGCWLSSSKASGVVSDSSRNKLIHHGRRVAALFFAPRRPDLTGGYYQQTLRMLGIHCSMSRRACCYDTATKAGPNRLGLRELLLRYADEQWVSFANGPNRAAGVKSRGVIHFPRQAMLDEGTQTSELSHRRKCRDNYYLLKKGSAGCRSSPSTRTAALRCLQN